MSLPPGSTLGPFRIDGLLGKGGMASVYKAYEAELDRHVALKVLPAEFLHDDTFAKRFEREAKVIAKLEHPHVVPIHRFGIDDGMPWMSMRLLSVGTLADVLAKGRVGGDRSLAILTQVADALDHAHRHGVIHRDVKPGNILLDEAERVYVADFGLAHLAEVSVVLTQEGTVAGTPQYMAPEQALGKPVDHRADIYALGVIAYQMLTRRVPFTADTTVVLLMMHAQEPVPVPPPAEVPEALIAPVIQCLAKKPDDRWPSANAFVSAFADGLKASATDATLLVTPPPPPVPVVEDTTNPDVEPPTLPMSPRSQTVTASVAPAPVPDAPSTRRSGLSFAAAAGAALVAALVAFFVVRDPSPVSPSAPPAVSEAPAPESSVACTSSNQSGPMSSFRKSDFLPVIRPRRCV